MPRSSHSPATLGSRRHHSVSRLLQWMLLAIAGLTAVPAISHAQTPGDPPGLRLVVATDRLEYKPGEPVRITIKVANPSNTERTLHFNSSHQVDYVIDGVWRWSDDKAFAQATTSIRIPAGGSHTFPEFTHLPSDHFLAAGRHEIVAELMGQNIQAVTSIAVAGDGDEPLPTGFLLSATVSPNPVPFGSTVELAVTVTNASNTAKTFGHDGCPVHYTIDGVYSPPLACPEYWNQVTLQPGQSIEFTAAQFSYLIIPTGRQNGLWPGHHSIAIRVPGIGGTAVRLEVTGEPGEVGSIAGHVSGENGEALEGVLVEAFTWSPNDSSLTGPGPNGNGTWGGYQAVTGPDGAYIISHLPVNPYLVRASRWGAGEIWYNGAFRPEEASPVYVNAGATTGNIDFVLPHDQPPPPPEFDALITGRITNDVGNTDQPTIPLSSAIVLAIPVRDAWPDSSGDPDETGTTRPWPPGDDPMYGNGFYGFPDSTGLYTIHLPLGTYRVIATAPGYRYEWWEESAGAAGADDVQAHSIYIDSIPPAIDFTLTPIMANTLTAWIEGTILGVTSDDHGYPPPDSGWVQPNSHPAEIVPLAGARVMARPLIQDPRLMTFREEVYYAETDSAGDYQVEVPVNSPFIVSAETSGYQPQTYMRDGEIFWFGTPVDVTPGAVTPDIDITLYGYPPPQEMEWIAGFVSRGPAVSNNESPVPGAIVRLQSATGFGYERIARTDEHGQFSFHGLPGFESYILSVEAEGFLPVYYPAAFNWQSAEPVHSWPVNTRVAPLRIQLSVPASDGPHFVVGVIRGEGGGGVPVDPPPPGGWDPGGNGDPATGTGGGLPDTTDWVWGLPGAFLYLVPADDAGTPGVRPVAGATACDNGTVLIENVPAGRYKAYADRPGYQPTWFHGTGPLSAAVISVGPGIDPIVVDIVMNPVDIVPPPGGGGEVRDAEARIVTNLHNSPNPFQPATTIIYRLMDSAPVSLEIYDVNGRLVRRMFDRVSQPAGEQHVPWDGRKDGGEAAGAGIYFYRVWTPTETSTGKMVRVR